jgi:hypothetical protein
MAIQVDKMLFEENSRSLSDLAEATNEIAALNRTIAELQSLHHTTAKDLDEMKKKSRSVVARNKELEEKISEFKSAKASSGAEAIPISLPPSAWSGIGAPINGRVRISPGDEEFRFVAALLNANLANHGDRHGTAAGQVHPEGFEVVAVQRIHNASLCGVSTACKSTS